MGKRLLEILGLTAGFSFLISLTIAPKYYQVAGFREPDVRFSQNQNSRVEYLGWDLDRDGFLDKSRVYGLIGGHQEVRRDSSEFKNLQQKYSLK